MYIHNKYKNRKNESEEFWPYDPDNPYAVGTKEKDMTYIPGEKLVFPWDWTFKREVEELTDSENDMKPIIYKDKKQTK